MRYLPDEPFNAYGDCLFYLPKETLPV